ncbi:MAG TPA: c-type cytochrome [Candidatus Sulfotelmatobacter sp.]|nr:c-type cytochrome [Candidatus Sulfotelmatobacter sp.]
MTADAQANLQARKMLFVVLLALICIVLVYAIFQNNKPWVVPEEVKRMKNPIAASEATLKAARGIYMDECAQCHGEHGKGDGPEAAMHSPAPSDITDSKHMNTVTDGELFYQISEGRKPMPSFKRRLKEDQRWELVLFVRSISGSVAPAIPEKVSGAGKKPAASANN